MADFQKIQKKQFVKTVKYLFFVLLLSIIQSEHNISPLYAEVNPLVREISVYRNDSVFRHTFYYDGNRNKVIENRFYVDRYSAYPISRTEWIYETNKCVSQREHKWNNTDWKTTYIINTEFNSDLKTKETFHSFKNNQEQIDKTVVYFYENNKLKSIETYIGTTENNIISEKTIYQYNDKQQISQQKLTTRESNESDTAYSVQYVYDLSGKLDSVILTNKNQDLIQNEYLTTYIYDKFSDNLTCQTQKKWNVISSKWESITKTEYAYNISNQLINEIFYHFNVMFWSPNTKYEYTYDSNGKLEQKVMYQPIYKQWRRIYTIEYGEKFNGQPNLMESKYNFWGGDAGTYINNYIPYYFNEEIAIMNANKMSIKYFIDTTFVTNAYADKTWLKIYPNPSNGVFYISTQEHYIENWEVFNLSGVMVKNNQNKYQTGVVDLTNLPDGMYMIKVKTSDNKILKQKIAINKTK